MGMMNRVKVSICMWMGVKMGVHMVVCINERARVSTRHGHPEHLEPDEQGITNESG